MTVNINKPQINLREQLKKLERPTTDRLVVKGSDGVLIDKLTGELSIQAIDVGTGGNAVDVFVYDTRKDSDGGAWRKRTSHTSWYNETLNTATRGSRREFPAVAVIVAKGDDTITIYDGDDPNLPMWMVMPVLTGWDSTTKVSALNGIIVMTNHGYNGTMFHVKFIEDSYNLYDGRHAVSLNSYTSYISDRATVASYSGTQISNIGLASADINDVAMTVLPNAPIDSATGLPVPTIAFATDRGVSVIKDDGIVVDLEHDSGTHETCRDIAFSEDKTKLLFESDVNDDNTYRRRVIVEDIPSADTTYTVIQNDSYQTTTGGYDNGRPRILGGNTSSTGINEVLPQAIASGEGITFLDNELDDILNSKVAYATTSYNTGWMNGDIKGAFLSDKTVESFSATNLVTENFSANWTGATNGVLSVSNGQLTITNSGGSNGRAQSNTFATTSGKKYAFIVKAVSNSSATYRSEVRGPELVAEGTTDGETLVIYFNGTGNSSTFVELYAIGGSGASATYEDAYVVEIEEDRSVTNKGLQVFGTIDKDPVATGAELVGYSGFSNSTNYLSQPRNSDLAIGNSDFSSVGWFKKTTSSNTGMIIYASDGANQTFDVRVHTDMKMLAQITDDGFSTREIVSAQGSTVNDNIWHQYHVVRRNNVMYSYLDGELLGTSTSVEANITNSLGITIGAENLSGNAKAFEGSLALIRFSKSAPSPEQIKKIYETEKVLFQENAACTLYGSSDAVTALAYDDTTNLLHVGTSSGRSEFKGLRRVSNTTIGVTTAISASNGLIAEQ